MRRSRYHNLKKERSLKPKRIGNIVGLTIFLVLSVLVFVFWKTVNLDKFTYVNKTKDGSAQVIVFDSKKDTVFRYLIPSDTELESARGYGYYKMSSLWTLSERDGNGDFIAETISKNYSIPVYLWKNGRGGNLNLFQNIKSVLIEKNKSAEDIKISTLKLPNSVLIQFLNDDFTSKIPTIDIEDLTGNISSVDKVSKIIEIMGGKITSNSQGYDEELDCEVGGKDTKMVKEISNIFDCEIKNSMSVQTDLKIRLGAKFSERF